MKTRALRSYLCFTLLATAFLLGLAGCDKEESEPLRIGDDSLIILKMVSGLLIIRIQIRRLSPFMEE